MNLIKDLIANGPDLLIAAGLIISAASLLPLMGYLFALTARSSAMVATWRRQRLLVTREAQVIRLEMAARDRAFRQVDSIQEAQRLRTAYDQVVRECADQRRLNVVQADVISARDRVTEKIEQDLDNVNNALEEMEEAQKEYENRAHEGEQTAETAQREQLELSEKVEELRLELQQRDSVMRLLENQVTTHEKSAAMANANASDLQRELANVRKENRNLDEKVQLLNRLTDHRELRVS